MWARPWAERPRRRPSNSHALGERDGGTAHTHNEGTNPTMSKTAAFRRQHDDILKIAGQLMPYLKAPARIAPESEAIRSILAQLFGALNVHLAMEDKGLYPKMLGSSDARVRAMAERYQAEMGGIGEVVQAYNTKWTAPAIAGDPRGFAVATKGLLQALSARIKAENTELYPLMDAAA